MPDWEEENDKRRPAGGLDEVDAEEDGEDDEVSGLDMEEEEE